MKASTIFTTLTFGATALAAPTWPKINSAAFNNGGLEQISDYFNVLAEKVNANQANPGAVPVCDLSKATLPQSTLEAPSSGTTLKHVAIGRGTQNYTCDTSNPSAAPVANGAVATLFNASCVAATYPDLLSKLSGMALQFDLSNLPASSSEDGHMGPSNLLVSGQHFFRDSKTAYFNLDTTNFGSLGHATFLKKLAVDAPADAPKGLQGEKAVPWLKLQTGGSEAVKIAATGGLDEVYRMGTAGGSPPATCAGMPATFEVQYAAEYWFYRK